jgi:hypothetical protein
MDSDPPAEEILPGILEEYLHYVERVAPRLPNFPEECLQQWLFDHRVNTLRQWSWLNIGSLRFREEMWRTESVVEQVISSNEPAVENSKLLLLQSPDARESSLGAYMIRNGTWPIAPMVLDNPTGAKDPNGNQLARFHLLEGHHRVGYLRALLVKRDWSANTEHRLWLVSVGSTGGK